MKDFLQLANERYSVRKFADREVEQDKIDKIVEAGIKAPTACLQTGILSTEQRPRL